LINKYYKKGESDIKYLEDVLLKVKPKTVTWVKADKCYKSNENDNVINNLKLRNHIMLKALKNKSLTEREFWF